MAPKDEYKGYSPYPDIKAAVKTALPLLEYVGKKAYGHYSGSKRKPKNMKRKDSRRKTGTVVNMDGSTGGRYRMGVRTRKRRKKKSLRQQISQVRRLIPKKSHKLYRDFETLVLPGVQNQRRIYDIACFTNSQLDTYATTLAPVDDSKVDIDYTATNSSLQYDLYYKLMLKNNMTANAVISYGFYVCKDDDNESPSSSIREELVDRGYTVSAGTAETAATATASKIPRRIIFQPSESYHAPVFGAGALNRNWKLLGGIKKAIIGPGDSTNLIFSKKITYKPEIKDQEGSFTYLSNYDIRLVIVTSGDIGHDQVNTSLIGRCAYQLDCEEQRQCNVTYANPKGLREVKYSDNLTDTGFTIPVHAANQASAIEIDDL